MRIRDTYMYSRFVNVLTCAGASWDEADSLLFRLRRYELAAARQWEIANTCEEYGRSAQCLRDEARLEIRCAKLKAELAAYGLQMENYGVYPTIYREIDGCRDKVSIFLESE